MITTSQKVVILRKAGVEVPLFPARKLPIQERFLRPGARVPQHEREADEEQRVAVEAWNKLIDRMYSDLLAQRREGSHAHPVPNSLSYPSVHPRAPGP